MVFTTGQATRELNKHDDLLLCNFNGKELVIENIIRKSIEQDKTRTCCVLNLKEPEGLCLKR